MAGQWTFLSTPFLLGIFRVAPVWYGGVGSLSRLAGVLDASRPCGTGAWGIHLRLAFRSVGRASVVRGRGATSDFRAVLAKVASVWGRGV